MKKYKVTVMTRSETPVIIVDDFDCDCIQTLRKAISDALQTETIAIRNHIFLRNIIAYIKIEEVE